MLAFNSQSLAYSSQASCGVLLKIVIPNSHHLPPAPLQTQPISPISPHIRFDFLDPVLSVAGNAFFPGGPIIAMPKVPIQKDDDLSPFKHKIWSSRELSVVLVK